MSPVFKFQSITENSHKFFIVFRNVNKVTISYLLVKNFDINSTLVIDVRQTVSFSVQNLNFNQIKNLIFADR